MRQASAAIPLFLCAALVLGAASTNAQASAAGDRRDLLWLGRTTYGPDSADLASFHKLGQLLVISY